MIGKEGGLKKRAVNQWLAKLRCRKRGFPICLNKAPHLPKTHRSAMFSKPTFTDTNQRITDGFCEKWGYNIPTPFFGMPLRGDGSIRIAPTVLQS